MFTDDIFSPYGCRSPELVVPGVVAARQLSPDESLLSLVLANCPKRTFAGKLFHGSGVEGVRAILKNGGFNSAMTSSRHHTTLPVVSFSTDAGILDSFSDDEEPSGFCFEIPPQSELSCLKHHGFFDDAGMAFWGWNGALDSSGAFSCRLEDSPELVELSEIAGLLPADGLGPIGLDGARLAAITENVDAFLLRTFYETFDGSEREIALTDRGCRKIWPFLKKVIIDGVEHAVSFKR